MNEEQSALIEKAGNLAKEYEKTCTGCAQAMVAGLLETLNLFDEGVFKSASGLADGIGLSGDGSCGALIGGSLVIGLLYGRGKKDHKDMMKPLKSYLLSNELYNYFCDRYGSSRCHDIQKSMMGRVYDMFDPNGLRDATNDGLLEKCSDIVLNTARKTAELILQEGLPETI